MAKKSCTDHFVVIICLQHIIKQKVDLLRTPSTVLGDNNSHSAANSEGKRLTRKEKRKLCSSSTAALPVATTRKYRKDAEHRFRILLMKDKNCEDSSYLPAAPMLRILSRMAYDASRSGTPHQVEAIVELTLTELNTIKSSSISNNYDFMVGRIPVVFAMDSFQSICSSMFHLALAGLSDTADLFDIILCHAAKALQFACGSSDSFAQNEHVVRQFLTGLSELALSGIFTCDFKRVGILELIKMIYRTLGWPNSCPECGIISSSEISIIPTPTHLKILLDEINTEYADDVSSFWMHSRTGGPLTVLWGHSIKQRKVRSISAKAKASDGPSLHETIGIKLALLDVWKGDSPLGFADMNAPLVVDIGCGFGVTLLGLAASHYKMRKSPVSSSSMYESILPLGTVNFLGCDLSNHCVAYASAIARKWQINSRCRFCVAPAESFLEWVRSSYPGPIFWVNIQFPTPYKLDESMLSQDNVSENIFKAAGNSEEADRKIKNLRRRNVQLPGINDDDGFMVTRKLISLSIDIALRNGSVFYFQSNVEDVAVYTRGLVLDSISTKGVEPRFISISEKEMMRGNLRSFNRKAEKVNLDDISDISLPNRKLIWAAIGGPLAEGENWLRTSPMPRYAMTETEAVYQAGEKPVYRFAFRAGSAVY